MAFWDFLNRKPKKTENLTKEETLKLMNLSSSYFTEFGRDITKSIIARSCIKPIAEASSKLNVQIVRKHNNKIVESSTNKKLERLISQQPNPFMNGKDFLYKTRYLLERDNTVFIFIDKDIYNNINGLYPIANSTIEIIEYQKEIFFVFNLLNGKIVAEFSQIAILRNDYSNDLIVGDKALNALLPALELVDTTNQGMSNTIKTSANLKGLLKASKSMLSNEDRKNLAQSFVSDYLNLENESGVAVLDASLDYIPIKNSEAMVNAEHMRELRENIMRYFGVNDNIMMSNFTPELWEAFYENKIEPFAIALGLELTNKCFSEHERAFGNQIIFSGNRLMYASTATKLSFSQLVDRGIMNRNEHREMLGLPPVPGGDEFVIRGEYKNTDEVNNLDEEVNQ